MDTLSIFVDESGRFQYPDNASRFYILGMVFHDQSFDISSLVAFIDSRREDFSSIKHIKVYYDCGQSPVTRLLQGTLADSIGESVEFKLGVKPSRYRLLQLADLVCTLHLIELRLAHGIPMTPSEMRFFGGPRDFKRNVLRKIKAKEIDALRKSRPELNIIYH